MEAEAEAKLNMHSKFSTSLEQLNCLGLNGLNPTGSVGMTLTLNVSNDLENINPNFFMHKSNASLPESVKSFSVRTNDGEDDCHDQDDDDDEMINAIVLEKCLLKVFDDLLVDESNQKSNEKHNTAATSGNQTLKNINIANLENIKCGKARLANDLLHLIDNNNNTKNHDLKPVDNFNYCNSISSSCSSPVSQKDDNTSPKLVLDKAPGAKKSTHSSVRLFRSINTSNTIYVQPTDIIIPLSEGDYNEYKLFPTSNDRNNDEQSPKPAANQCLMGKLLDNIGQWATNSDDIEIYSPPLSSLSSVSSSCSSSSINSPLSNSPPLTGNKPNNIKFYLK